MEFKLRIEIDVTPKVEELVERLITAIHYRENVEGIQRRVSEAEASVPETDTDEAEKREATAPGTEPKPVESYPDDDEMRNQMDIVITKFAGSGWKDSKEPRVLAIKKGCAKVFKEISAWLGAERPSMLEGPKRLEFVERLKEVFIEEKEGKQPEIVFRPF